MGRAPPWLPHYLVVEDTAIAIAFVPGSERVGVTLHYAGARWRGDRL